MCGSILSNEYSSINVQSITRFHLTVEIDGIGKWKWNNSWIGEIPPALKVARVAVVCFRFSTEC